MKIFNAAFGFLDNLRKRRRRRDLWSALHAELDRNLELCHVFQQRGVLDKFYLDAWRQIKDQLASPEGEFIADQLRRVEIYNELMEEIRLFEKNYSADVANKTLANAKELHRKKEAAWEKFESIPLALRAVREVDRNLSK
ncbi:MAG: hypothetical protein WC552_02510 [Candidatus Omnitrophota bacterium]